MRKLAADIMQIISPLSLFKDIHQRLYFIIARDLRSSFLFLSLIAHSLIK